MKKLLLIAFASVFAFAAGCGNASEKDAEKTPETTNDSIATALGKTYGASASAELAGEKDLVKSEFVEGLSFALNTTDPNALNNTGYSLQQQLQKATGPQHDSLASRLQGMSAGIGMQQMFNYLAAMGENLDKNAFLAAFKSSFLAQQAPDVTAERATVEQFLDRIQEKAMAENKEQAEKNDKEGKAYIEKQMNADKSIQKTASGLAYKVLQKGNGPRLKDGDVARLKYTGKHIDGSVFDDGGGQIAEFSPAQVVAGFGEGLMLMNVGSKYRFYIPGNLGYGMQGTPGGPIGPNEMLIFDVELIGIK